jgi:probable F420-dependent oxidoreductase
MKFGIMFANVGPFGTPELLGEFAIKSEQAGIESLWTVEHVVVPVDYQSRYPYSPTGRMPGEENWPIPDPILPLAFAAALTKRIRLGTGVVILPQRHPFYVAKEVATLDVLSSGRAIFGIGVGWLEEEFRSLGISFEDRAARTHESVRAIRSLWRDEPEPFEGKFFRWGPVQSNPKPVQKPGVPIVVGGHTEIAAKRAARYGDGFFPAGNDPEHLARLFGILRGECRRIGRDPAEIELSVGAGVVNLDQVRRFEDLGVARLGIAPMGFDRDAFAQGLAQFHDEIIAKV